MLRESNLSVERVRLEAGQAIAPKPGRRRGIVSGRQALVNKEKLKEGRRLGHSK